MAHKDGAILFHRNTGKDRTGVAAVLLRSALGVDRDTVMKDFDLTNDFDCALNMIIELIEAIIVINRFAMLSCLFVKNKIKDY
ncbi:tyrosine-protein phosphatase [Acetobacterium sp.]|uniref:tyrosine-protein phosphatase n=1 Tax=Acetobacterium sp. TaxID=1872094 RepID=UPI002F411D94